jgi:hypothetical protein
MSSWLTTLTNQRLQSSSQIAWSTTAPDTWHTHLGTVIRDKWIPPLLKLYTFRIGLLQQLRWTLTKIAKNTITCVRKLACGESRQVWRHKEISNSNILATVSFLSNHHCNTVFIPKDDKVFCTKVSKTSFNEKKQNKTKRHLPGILQITGTGKRGKVFISCFNFALSHLETPIPCGVSKLVLGRFH